MWMLAGLMLPPKSLQLSLLFFHSSFLLLQVPLSFFCFVQPAGEPLCGIFEFQLLHSSALCFLLVPAYIFSLCEILFVHCSLSLVGVVMTPFWGRFMR